MKRVFLIGFNKCGTTSFHDFFKKNGYSSVHWRGNTLAMRIRDNIMSGERPVLRGLDHWTAYSDMICLPGSPWNNSNSDSYPLIEACRYYKELHMSYPNSYFILNTRPIEDWIGSRLKHDGGKFASAYLRALEPLGIVSQSEMIDYWIEEWKNHHIEVAEYFLNAANNRFMLFDISQSDSHSLAEFLSEGMTITSPAFPHSHKTE